jgi:flagellar biosynthesis/type III secretory pathway M-ring protein FliF/YscJ
VAVLIVIIVFLLIAAIVAVVGAPLRRAAAAAQPDGERADERARRDELEAAREAKYREIRDAEMDFRTGKLSESDYRTLDAELRAEALRILDELQALDG